MSKDLQTAVERWLEEQGYPLEMEAAWDANIAEFDVTQSDFFVDPETSESREINLTLTLSKISGNNYNSYRLFVECKSSPGSPWIIFGSHNVVKEGIKPLDLLQRITLEALTVCSKHGQESFHKIVENGQLKNIYPRPTEVDFVGHGLVQALGKRDAAYSALMSATKAAISNTGLYDRPGLSTPNLISFPVILIDSPLYLATFNQFTKKAELKPMEHGIIHWRHRVANQHNTAVYVVTKSYWKQFLKLCSESGHWWINHNHPEANTSSSRRVISRGVR
jgi:hypothetical protein